MLEPERIKLVSGALLAGHTVRLASDWPVQGTPPGWRWLGREKRRILP